GCGDRVIQRVITRSDRPGALDLPADRLTSRHCSAAGADLDGDLPRQEEPAPNGRTGKHGSPHALTRAYLDPPSGVLAELSCPPWRCGRAGRWFSRRSPTDRCTLRRVLFSSPPWHIRG